MRWGRGRKTYCELKEEKIAVRHGRLVKMTVLTEWEVNEEEESARPIKKSVVYEDF